MDIEFLHFADIHLGYQQYGLRERFNDFGQAFERAVTYALNHKAKFVLIAGVFDKRKCQHLMIENTRTLTDTQKQ